MKGGTFQTFTDKTYQPLTDDNFIKHLNDELSTGLFQKEHPIAGKLAIELNNEIHISRIGLRFF